MGHFPHQSRDFILGLESLEDLQELSGRDLFPLVERVRFHFGQLQENLEQMQKSTSGLDSIERILKHYVHTVLDQYIFRTKEISQLNFLVEGEGLSLTSWNRLVDALPLCIRLLETFPLFGTVKVSMRDGVLRVKSQTKELSGDIPTIRQKTYKIFRELCRRRVLLTHKLHEQGKERELEFIFDLRENSDLVYVFHWDKKDILLGFNSIFFFYRHEDAEKLCHKSESALNLYYRVTEEFELQKLTHQEVTKLLAEKKYELYEFPFLFRSIGLIMPEGGRSCSVEEWKKESQKRKTSFLDFFSLICDDC